MYQAKEKATTYKTTSVTIHCELWRLLPPHEQECPDEAEMKIAEFSFEEKPSEQDLEAICTEHFPGWTLSSWWTPETEEVF